MSLNDWLVAFENPLRLSVFLGVLIALMILEALFPRKARTQTRRRRWTTNIGIIIADTLAVRLLIPVLAVGVAAFASAKGWGLFNMISAPFWLEVILAFVLLDMLIYAQHVASHKIPILWRIHKVHHVDRDIDVTTAIRFHPLEIILSMGYKFLCILMLGPAVVAVIIFEIVLNASAMFNHANLRLPLRVDRVLRRIIVTPDMHRVHHSTLQQETDSNYGFNLSLWDRLFRTYTDQPSLGHDNMHIGLEPHQTAQPTQFWWSLFLPFHRQPQARKANAE